MDETGELIPDPPEPDEEPEPPEEPYPSSAAVGDEDLPLMVLRVLDSFDERRRTDRAALRQSLQEVVGRVEFIEAYLDSLEPKDEESAEKPVPLPFRGRATGQDWSELADWVDWLLATYQPSNEHRIAPCWAAHDGAPEHLAGLHRAWQAAMLKDADSRGPNDAAAYWHKNFLWPVLADVSRMIPNQCSTSEHTAPRAAVPTDRSLLPAPATVAAAASG